MLPQPKFGSEQQLLQRHTDGQIDGGQRQVRLDKMPGNASEGLRLPCHLHEPEGKSQ
ncbi:hypothetical protein D1872_280540 [compost metagenome]